MTRRLVLATLVLLAGCRLRSEQPADLVLRGGEVYTAAPAQPWASALAITGGRIVFVGEDSVVIRWIGRGTRVVDLAGKLVLPGFIDSHVHPAEGGVELGECNLTDDTTAAQALAAVGRCASEHPGNSWVRGSGWQLPLFPSGNPNKTALDSIVPDRPVYLAAADGHSAWVNSAALKLAGVTRATRDPANGRIERDRRGEPSGTLRENAMDLVSRLLPAYSVEDFVAGIRRAQAQANAFGITALFDAHADSIMLEAYRRLDSLGELTTRVRAAQDLDPDSGVAGIDRLRRLRKRFRGRLLSADAVKIFEDGVIEARTAAMLAPYLDKPGDRGDLNVEPEDLARLVTALDRDSFQVHVHAIGDRAIRVSLDAFQRTQEANGVRDSRHIIAHLELIDPADIPRFKSLGVIADFQPLWAYPDDYITDLTIPAMGPARSRWLYPINSVLKTGAVVVGGSDWTVSSLNPLDAIQVAVTRRDPVAPPGEAWIPEEVAPLPAMVDAYTRNGAYAIRLEGVTGTLEVGKAADLVVLDRNIFTIPPQEIHRAHVLLTLLEGRTVFADSLLQ